MKRKAYLLVFDGLADWEPAHALCEINKSGKFEIATVGFSHAVVTTMGGLRVSPDVTLNDVGQADTAIFILPGGDMWEQGRREEVETLLVRLHEGNVPIGALCAATLEIARAGLTHNLRHTSNSKAYLKKMVPRYNDENFYVNELAVTDQNIITASGLGSVDFAREVLRLLEIYSEADTAIWFGMFKSGKFPAGVI
jgi:putative intracellular protease/amidase